MKFPRNAFVSLLPKPAAAPLEQKYKDELKRVKTEIARVEAAKRKKQGSFQETSNCNVACGRWSGGELPRRFRWPTR